MIEEKPTMETTDGPSEEGSNGEQALECVADPAKLGGKKIFRTALVAGIIGLVLVGALVGVLVSVVGKSDSNDASASQSNANNNEEFDFSDLGTNFTEVTEEPTVPPPPDTDTPSQFPTKSPSIAPTKKPSPSPTLFPTSAPSLAPSTPPTSFPSLSPTKFPSLSPTTEEQHANYTSQLTFCVIADVPYYPSEALALPGQIATQMEDCEFMVHLGDIMAGTAACTEGQYTQIRDLMLLSTVPVFMIPGDNEWNDCGNAAQIDQGWSLWTEYLLYLDAAWNHNKLQLVRQPNHIENFFFIRKRTLIFGLNIVGGRVHDADEWQTRLTDEADWVMEVIGQYVPIDADGIIIMAHAKATSDHSLFFNPMKDFINNDLQNAYPILYLHGDGHAFVHQRGFFDTTNYMAIQHEGGVRDPILKIFANPSVYNSVNDAFQFDRQLELDTIS
jgi:hypothetical protein